MMRVERNSQPPAPSRPWSALTALGLACVVGATCVFALIGWGFDIPWLRISAPGTPRMSLVAGACCLICAIAVAELARQMPRARSLPRRAEVFISGCGALVILMSGLRMLVWFVDLGAWVPNEALRMAPATAIVLHLTGWGLLLATYAQATAELQLVATFNTAICWVIVLSYAFGGERPEVLRETAPHTAGVLFLLNVGLLCARPEATLIVLATSRRGSGKIFRQLIPLVLLLPAVLGVTQLVVVRSGAIELTAVEPLFAALAGVISAGFIGALALRMHRTEETLHELLTLRSAILDSGAYAVISTTRDGIVTQFNPAAERLLGYSAPELIGRQTPLLIHQPQETPQRDTQPPDELGVRLLPSLGDFIPRTRSNRPLVNENEWTMVRKDGSQVQVMMSVTPLRDDTGEITGYVGMAVDISEHVQAREATARLAAIVASSDDAIISKTLTGTITSWNPGAERLFGYTDAEAIGRPIHMLLPADRLQEETTILDRISRGLGVKHFETLRVRKDGTLVEISVSASPMRDMSGQVVGAAKIARDISARKRVEAQLQDRTEELLRSNADLEQFAYVASHDLQEPLRMVNSFVTLLEKRYKDRLDAQAMQYIGFAVDGTNRMRQLIQDLLSYSRVGSDKTRKEPVAMHRVFELACANLRATIQETAAQVTADELPEVVGVEGQLIQLLQNLIGNALKYHAADRPPVVRVGVRKLDTQWEFSVQDNGIGIEPQFWTRIFQVFQRLHAREKYSGTGIGLAICERIVLRHGGAIRVTSEPNAGSTFIFTLPAS